MIKGALIRYHPDFGGSRDQPEPGSLPQRMPYIVYRAEVKTLACEVGRMEGDKGDCGGAFLFTIFFLKGILIGVEIIH